MLEAKFKHSKKESHNKLVTSARGEFRVIMEEKSQLLTSAAHFWHDVDLCLPERESVHISVNNQ